MAEPNLLQFSQTSEETELMNTLEEKHDALPNSSEGIVQNPAEVSPTESIPTQQEFSNEPESSGFAVSQSEQRPSRQTQGFSKQTPRRDSSASRVTPALSSDNEADTKVRRSTRDIKRPKFDDELVDSGIGLHASLAKRRMSERSSSSFSMAESAFPSPQIAGPSIQPFTSSLTIDTTMGTNTLESASPSPFTASPSNWTGKSDQNFQSSSANSTKKHDLRQRTQMISLKDRMAMDDAIQEEEAARVERRRRESRIASKDIRAKEFVAAVEAAESPAFGLMDWTGEDDVALVTALTHVADINAVQRGIVFSKDYTVAEMEERWYQLMYDEPLSRQAKKRMHDLPAEIILKIQSRTIFSEREEEILREVRMFPNPTFDTMADLIRDHPEEFHSARTPQILLDHWHLMVRNQVLPKPAALPISANFERFEKNTALSGTNIMGNSTLRVANEFQQLGANLGKIVVQPVAGIVSDNQLSTGAVATLVGKVVRFVIRKDNLPASIGRNTTDSSVDVNLALEGPSSKISRKQAQIIMDSTGEFWLKNVSPTMVIVDGKKIDEGMRTRLINNSVLEFGVVKLIFRVVSNPLPIQRAPILHVVE